MLPTPHPPASSAPTALPSATAATIDSFVGDLDERQIEADDDQKLKVEFDEEFRGRTQADFTITVQFAEGCSVTF